MTLLIGKQKMLLIDMNIEDKDFNKLIENGNDFDCRLSP